MELLNHSPLPATLIRGIIDDNSLFGSLVVRATFDLVDGKPILAEDQAWKVSSGPWDGPQGKMPGDELFYRGGVDVFIFGHARARDNTPVGRSEVVVRVGEGFRRTVVVNGTRVWIREGGSLVPSAPEPFTEVPLALSESFGGQDVWDELPIPFPDNPGGKGFYVSEESAVGKVLPRLEDPAHPVTSWKDRPEPVGVSVPPFPFGPRLSRTVEFDAETGDLKRIDPKFYNQSFPGMTAEAPVRPGAKVVVSGVSVDGDLGFVLPMLDLRVKIVLGEKVVETDVPIDQIGIECDLRRLFVTYRYPFRYIMRREEKRSCELFLKAPKTLP
jgi:hypothetical protein